MKTSMSGRTDFIDTIQRFVAVECIGASALRGQGAGVIDAVREYLAELELGRIPQRSRPHFEAWLDCHTEGILETLPIPNRPWGAARKGLDLFLRSVLYNHYLRAAYSIGAVEAWLEVPLDSVVGNALKRKAGRGALPQWPGLKHLTPEANAEFQQFAEELAKQMGLSARVFLDNYLWLRNR